MLVKVRYSIQNSLLQSNIEFYRKRVSHEISISAPVTEKFPDHMKEEKEFAFRVVVLQASNVAEVYSDVFCQFK